MNRFCCDSLCDKGRNCPLEFKDTVPDYNEWLTRWMAENSEPVRYQMQMAPRTPEQIAELARQSMNAAWNIEGDGLRNAWPPRPFENVRIHASSDFYLVAVIYSFVQSLANDYED